MISQPQAGILGTYAVVKRPWVVQDEMGEDVIAIRSIMNLTLTYDHRLVDGALAGRFLRDLREPPPDLGRVGLLRPAATLWARESAAPTCSTSAGRRTVEAWELQRSLAAAVSQGAIPDTVLLLEHPPVITLGRRTDGGAELHVPDDAAVEVVETDRGGKSTFHGPGQLVCYPILDLNRHGRDVKRYVRDLEEAVIRTVGAFGLKATRIEGLTGVWLERRRGSSARSACTSPAG